MEDPEPAVQNTLDRVEAEEAKGHSNSWDLSTCSSLMYSSEDFSYNRKSRSRSVQNVNYATLENGNTWRNHKLVLDQSKGTSKM